MLSDVLSDVIGTIDEGVTHYKYVKYNPEVLATVQAARDKLAAVCAFLNVPVGKASVFITGSQGDTPGVRRELEALEERLARSQN